MVCEKCGAQLGENARICRICGAINMNSDYVKDMVGPKNIKTNMNFVGKSTNDKVKVELPEDISDKMVHTVAKQKAPIGLYFLLIIFIAILYGILYFIFDDIVYWLEISTGIVVGTLLLTFIISKLKRH